MVALGSTAIDTTKFGSLDVTSLYLGSNEAWTAGEPAELIKPTSIANSGGTASVGTNGQVTFSGVTSLSLNEVFSADFDNYVVSIRHKLALGNDPIQMRLRVSGSDASGTDYTRQRILASGTAVQGLRSTSQTSAAVGYASADYGAGDVAYIYGPFLAQPTAFRHNNAGDISGGSIYEYASTHSLSTSYDGFTLIPASSSLTGALQVYGIRM